MPENLGRFKRMPVYRGTGLGRFHCIYISVKRYILEVEMKTIQGLPVAAPKDSIDEIHLSNDSPDDKLSNGTSFILIVILGVSENIVKFVLLKGQI